MGAEHAGRPVLVGDHPALPREGRCRRRDRGRPCRLSRARRRASSGRRPRRSRTPRLSIIASRQLDAQLGVAGRVGRRPGTPGWSTAGARARTAEVGLRVSTPWPGRSINQAEHPPTEMPSKPYDVGVVVQTARPRAGRRSAAERTHGLVGLVVLLELVLHLLAHRGARLAAGSLLLERSSPR